MYFVSQLKQDYMYFTASFSKQSCSHANNASRVHWAEETINIYHLMLVLSLGSALQQWNWIKVFTNRTVIVDNFDIRCTESLLLVITRKYLLALRAQWIRNCVCYVCSVWKSSRQFHNNWQCIFSATPVDWLYYKLACVFLNFTNLIHQVNLKKAQKPSYGALTEAWRMWLVLGED